jgi:hypothetical protein
MPPKRGREVLAPPPDAEYDDDGDAMMDIEEPEAKKARFNRVYALPPSSGKKPIPAGAEDVLKTDIKNGDQMVDFFGEYALGRYYTLDNFQRLPDENAQGFKLHPLTRQVIRPEDVTTYVAEIPVGGRRKRRSKTQKKKTRRSRSTRKA